jgi:hypothetical protein
MITLNKTLESFSTKALLICPKLRNIINILKSLFWIYTLKFFSPFLLSEMMISQGNSSNIELSNVSLEKLTLNLISLRYARDSWEFETKLKWIYKILKNLNLTLILKKVKDQFTIMIVNQVTLLKKLSIIKMIMNLIKTQKKVKNKYSNNVEDNLSKKNYQFQC